VETAKTQTQVVIVGGGFGGLTLARALARAPVSVAVVDRENHHLFQPLLYQVATASLSPGDIATPIRSVLGSQDNARVLLGEVVTVDFDARHLVLADGGLVSYDYLVIAAGAKTNFFGHDEWAEHAYPLKSLRDALRIRERILMAFEAAEREPDDAHRRALLTFVVIGGGPTGVEMAGAISELSRQTLRRDFRVVRPSDIRVVLVEMADRVLTPFDEELSASARVQLEELEVEVRTGQRVTDVGPRGVEVDGAFIEAPVVIWASGVEAVSLASRLDTPRHRDRLVVREDCSLPDRPEVFAIGDIAYFVPAGEEEALPGLSPVAMQQAKHVARQIVRSEHRTWGQSLPREPFYYRDKGIMATIGRSRAVAQAGSMRLHGYVAWIAWLFIHIFFLIGFRNRVMVMLSWVWQYVTFRRGARLVAQPKGVAASELARLLNDWHAAPLSGSGPAAAATDERASPHEGASPPSRSRAGSP
jgi:NADH dehydrogenase